MKTFALGKVATSKSIFELTENDDRFNRFVAGCLSRFAVHDWGDLEPEDWDVNDETVEHDAPRKILACYMLPALYADDINDRLWIITSEDRKETKILFPEDM